MSLQNKRILLGISGGIAAYKAPELVRRLKEQGAEVRCVLTESAKAFVTPLSLQAVSGFPVSDDLLDPAAEAAMGHIELAKWADMLLVAPATANTLAKISHGMADDLLTTICLATAAPIKVAPAMNQQMYRAQATQRNLAMLEQLNIDIWGPGDGDQACGDIGPGRMLDVPELVTLCAQALQDDNHQLMAGCNLVITAGPTREAIDPVRFISNHSSGKMGFALAQQAQALGANVTIITGPVNLPTPANCQRVDVVSAKDMHDAAMRLAPNADMFIACAAVADYRPVTVAQQKIKKHDDALTVKMEKNPDIVADVAALQKQRPLTVGFAAETQDVEHYAKGKLARKNLDMIAANNVAISGQGFNSDNNALTLYWQGGEEALPLSDKQQQAKLLLIRAMKLKQSHEKN